MAEPKKKLSKTRTHRRRAGYKIASSKPIICPNCHAPTLPHMACMKCGFYKGKPVRPQTPTKRLVVGSDEASK